VELEFIVIYSYSLSLLMFLGNDLQVLLRFASTPPFSLTKDEKRMRNAVIINCLGKFFIEISSFYY
jgi:hypothetical protein